MVKKLKTPKVRELLKKATKLKKQNKIEEAIRVLEEAYSVGELEPARSYSSFIVSSELDNYYTIEDLVRKSKYLQTAGKIDESLAFLDQIILETNKSAKNNIWEIFSLSSLYDYRSIILKKEKRYNEAFVSKIKYYCLDGIASFHRTGEEKKEKVIEEVVQVRSELDQYQEDLKRKRQEQLDKRTQTSVEKQSLFLVRPKKDPHRGMCWVDPYPSINQGRLGHSQVWTEKKPKRYYD